MKWLRRAFGQREWRPGRWHVWLDWDIGAVLLPACGVERCGDAIELWARVGAQGPDPLVAVTVKVPRPRR